MLMESRLVGMNATQPATRSLDGGGNDDTDETLSQAGTTKDDDDDDGGFGKGHCKICLEEHDEADSPEGPMVSPCACRGSAALIHTECLKQWHASRGHPEQLQCPTCLQVSESFFHLSLLFFLDLGATGPPGGSIRVSFRWRAMDWGLAWAYGWP